MWLQDDRMNCYKKGLAVFTVFRINLPDADWVDAVKVYRKCGWKCGKPNCISSKSPFYSWDWYHPQMVGLWQPGLPTLMGHPNFLCWTYGTITYMIIWVIFYRQIHIMESNVLDILYTWVFMWIRPTNHVDGVQYSECDFAGAWLLDELESIIAYPKVDLPRLDILWLVNECKCKWIYRTGIAWDRYTNKHVHAHI